jgi:hydrogenosomal chaperonin HSP60|nr:MAG TPA: Heat shock protein 60 [Caudoviricetes sp.]
MNKKYFTNIGKDQELYMDIVGNYKYDENEGMLIEENGIHPALNISNEPMINVMSDTEFQKRVAKVFQMISDVLEKSYGPYGSSSIIENYPYHYMTKDGFSIMKYITLSKKYNIIDDAIRGLIVGPCNKLNFLVGDGTTTAILATNKIYQSYMDKHDDIMEFRVPPRDIMKSYNNVKDLIIKELDNETEKINVENHDEMVNIINKIAYITSNGDEEITKLFTELYDELGYPIIDVVKAPDGITKKRIIDGYHYDLVLKDAIYVNNDDRTATYKNMDVIMIDHKVSADIFNYILLPLNNECAFNNRHLLVIAPSYDDVAMLRMRQLLLDEYKQTHDVNMVLTVANINFGNNRDCYDDLAMLLNTTVLTRTMVSDIIKYTTENDDVRIYNIIDINNRNIKDITITTRHISDNDDTKYTLTKVVDTGNISNDNKIPLFDTFNIRCGYAGNVRISMEESDGGVFNNLIYDKEIYDKTIKNIEVLLEEAVRKNEKLGTLDFMSDRIRTRLFKLKMKIGSIEVGGVSQLSVDMLKDSVDDTVKATSSAFYNGIVRGCSVSTLRAINYARKSESLTDLERIIINCIFDGFKNLYKSLLNSRYHYIGDKDLIITEDISYQDIYKILLDDYNLNLGNEYDILPLISRVISEDGDDITSIYELLIFMSMHKNSAIDLTSGEFNENVINTARTDKEVLIASTDLIGLLITGNQLIVMDN